MAHARGRSFPNACLGPSHFAQARQLGRTAAQHVLQRQRFDDHEIGPEHLGKDFADAAYWNANITTDADGTAEVSFKMPENLTDWKLRTWAMGPGPSVGEATASVVTAKNIMVRLQAPRFFVEKDEVVLSALVHNYLEVAKTAKVGLQLSGGCLEPIEGSEKSLEIPAGGDVRVDWRVNAVR